VQKGTSVDTALDTRAFRQIVGQFPTGVSVVATELNGEIHGMTVNSLTSLSLNPMLMLFCVDKKTKMAELIQQAKGFSINILREEQQALSTYFAGAWKKENTPPFRFVEWKGGPRLEGCAAAIGCRMHTLTEVGDHFIVVGESIALHLGIEPRFPLVFHSGLYRRLGRQEDRPAPELENGRMDVRVFFDPWDEA
jgi:flavin reductase (DIM6/NTAB) family NADH-FMN oxidoreductase RutF